MERIADITVEKRLKFSSKEDKAKKLKVMEISQCGYVTLEQFAEDTKKIINNYCDTHDIH